MRVTRVGVAEMLVAVGEKPLAVVPLYPHPPRRTSARILKRRESDFVLCITDETPFQRTSTFIIVHFSL
jgi:hypothetical protein